jgi:hypothetical protein
MCLWALPALVCVGPFRQSENGQHGQRKRRVGRSLSELTDGAG